MKVSIAMATYNGANYIGEQLESFLAQTRLPDEVIITDDGSSDSTMNIVESFAITAPFKVSIYKNTKNLGYCNNFQKALTKSTGDIVLLSDQDDYWFPDKIKKTLDLIELEPTFGVYINNAELTNAKLMPVSLTTLGQIESSKSSNKSYVLGCCCAIRRSFLDMVLPFPEGISSHDRWLVELASGLGLKKINSEVLQYYRRHGNNESASVFHSLHPVTKWDFRKNAVSELFRGGGVSKLANDIKYTKSFLQGLEDIQQKNFKDDPLSISDTIDAYKCKLDFIQLRFNLSKMFFFKRCIEAYRLRAHPCYPNNAKFQNLIRDIVSN